ncbi:MucR family transcriptional regulator [Sphingomonas sp. Ag1]|jgi:predicted transcriptional regulator|uniref:MucR family transcriptional regulator n=1 Tax=Sphingomonas sp. Ag1 TaxID=1642949 RepID=UPI000621F6EB|nr:MucR family transcriptional regulator [Sphingomonas sp. Ag1]KKI17984.1 transcriptional regulator [Sphingomonas sp. Ag1]
MSNETTSHVELATDVTVAWLSNPNTRADVDDIPTFLKTVHDALGALITPVVDASDQEPGVEYTPAVSVRKSLADPNFIISLLDGGHYKALKRHLAAHGLTPAEYRQRYGLKDSYPLVAPAYSEARRKVAKKLGLGRKPGQMVWNEAAAAAKPIGKKRKSAADAKAAAVAHLRGGAE